jgi:hypothetical protein
MTSGTALVLVLITFACTNTSPTATSISSPLSPVVYTEWAIAQKNLVAYVGDRAHSVMPEMFLWKEHLGKFPCPPIDEPRFNGCFHPDALGGPRIEWDRAAPSILHHESGHAILWAVQDPRWDCFEHDDPAYSNYEPACGSGVRR